MMGGGTAVMQKEPTNDQINHAAGIKKSAGTEAICRSDENVQVLQVMQVLHTKSPAQSDCCPAQNQGWIPVSERMPEDE